MTAAAFPAGIVPARPAWRSLLDGPGHGAVDFLDYWQPAIPENGIPTTAARLMTYALIAVGLWLGLERTDLTPGQRRTTWLAAMVPFTLWGAVAWSAAINGVFRTGVSPLPVLPLAIFLPVIIGAPLLLLSKRVGQVLEVMPATCSSHFSFTAYSAASSSLPGCVGCCPACSRCSAAPIAVATGTAQGRRAAIIWNIFGLADFAVAITLGLITSPGQFQLIVPNVPSIGAGAYPMC